MISILLIYFSLKFGYPWAILLLLITWILDLVLIVLMYELFEKIIVKKYDIE